MLARLQPLAVHQGSLTAFTPNVVAGRMCAPLERGPQILEEVVSPEAGPLRLALTDGAWTPSSWTRRCLLRPMPQDTPSARREPGLQSHGQVPGTRSPPSSPSGGVLVSGYLASAFMAHLW